MISLAEVWNADWWTAVSIQLSQPTRSTQAWWMNTFLVARSYLTRRDGFSLCHAIGAFTSQKLLRYSRLGDLYVYARAWAFLFICMRMKKKNQYSIYIYLAMHNLPEGGKISEKLTVSHTHTLDFSLSASDTETFLISHLFLLLRYPCSSALSARAKLQKAFQGAWLFKPSRSWQSGWLKSTKNNAFDHAVSAVSELKPEVWL